MNHATLERTPGWLRLLLGRPARVPAEPEPACCVHGCASGPLVLVAARGASSLWMCAPHAERWLDSAEGFAAENDPRRGMQHLARWAAAASAPRAHHP